MRYYIFISLLMLSGWAQAQTDVEPDSTDSPRDKDSIRYGVHIKKSDIKILNQSPTPENSEIVAMDSIDLKEVTLLGRYDFKDRKERRKYLLLKKKVRHVWPYAILATKRFEALQKRLDALDSKHKQKQYTRRVQRYVKDKFKERLKKLTKTEGQILVKLLYRQTGETTYELIRGLRSGWNAFWMNTKAKLFTISLKEKYDPHEIKGDYFIERILQRGFQKGDLDYQDPDIDIDFPKSMDKWE